MEIICHLKTLFNLFLIKALLFALLLFLINPLKVTSQSILNLTTNENNVLSELNSTCDTITKIFQKVIDLSVDQEFVYELERYDNGDYLAVGQIGRNAYSPEGFAVRFDSHGDIVWAKIIGVDTKRGQDDFFFNIDIAETFDGMLMMPDESVVLTMDRKTDNEIPTTEQQALIKIDKQGNILWSKILKHNSHEFFIDFLGADSSNNILLSGITFNGTFSEENISSILKISQENTIESQISFRSPPERLFVQSRITYLNGSILARPFLSPFSSTNNNQPIGTILFKLNDDLILTTSPKYTV